MTQNKIWYEAGNPPKKPYNTEEKTITGAKKLSAMYPQLYLVDATTEESLAVEPKFKIGDKVNVFDAYTQQTALCTVEEIIIEDSYFLYKVKNNNGTDIKAEIYLTHA